MIKVKIIQVFGSYEDDYSATQTDTTQITDWEEIDPSDLYYVKLWLAEKNRTSYGSNRETHYAALVIPEVPIPVIKSIHEIIDTKKKLLEQATAKQKQARERAEATKIERKRKTFERLKKELAVEE